jgi:hypothetical protein
LKFLLLHIVYDIPIAVFILKRFNHGLCSAISIAKAKQNCRSDGIGIFSG